MLIRFPKIIFNFKNNSHFQKLLFPCFVCREDDIAFEDSCLSHLDSYCIGLSEDACHYIFERWGHSELGTVFFLGEPLL